MSKITVGIGGTLEQLLAQRGLSEAKFSRIIGLPRATINRITSGRTPDPRASTLKVIAEYFDVTIDQLLGKQMASPTVSSPSQSTLHTSIPIISTSKVQHWRESTLDSAKDPSIDWLLTEIEMEEMLAVRVEGDAMWPQFQEGSLLIIDPEKSPSNRDFVLVHLKETDDVVFRQLSSDGNIKILKPINEIFPTIQLEESDKFLGVVVQTRSNYA